MRRSGLLVCSFKIGLVKLLPLLFFALIVAGCTKQIRHPLRGQVLEVHAESAQIIVQHEEIPGFMAAMTMPYVVKDPSNFPRLKPGDLINAQVVGSGDKFWLESVSVTGHAEAEKPLREPPPPVIKVGDVFPDFEFTNQDGKVGRLSDLKGKAVLLTFIYTRCPMPNFCPRLSSAFAKLQAKQIQGSHFVSVSMDPKYDSSSVLRKYGLAYMNGKAEGFANWDFVFTKDLRKVAGAMDLEYEEDSGQIGHTMVIALIGKNGKLAKDWGSQWNLEELEQALASEAAR